jgi:hypothetical protein
MEVSMQHPPPPLWHVHGAKQVVEVMLVRSLYRYGPKAVTGLLPRPGRGRPTNPWLVDPRHTVL